MSKTSKTRCKSLKQPKMYHFKTKHLHHTPNALDSQPFTFQQSLLSTSIEQPKQYITVNLRSVINQNHHSKSKTRYQPLF